MNINAGKKSVVSKLSADIDGLAESIKAAEGLNSVKLIEDEATVQSIAHCVDLSSP
jgi:hypothetical protein